jgi:hypothetical protein
LRGPLSPACRVWGSWFAADPRKIGGQALGHPIDELLLLRISADVGERQKLRDLELKAGHKAERGQRGSACAYNI